MIPLRTTHILICILLFHAGAPVVLAQNPHLFFTQYNTHSGLSSNNCTNIIRDNKGFAWIGTANGLNRFDGYQFKTFYNTPGDSTSLYNNIVYRLHQDIYGKIWVGHAGVLSRLNDDGNTFTHYKNVNGNNASFSGARVVNFFDDSKGNLWVVTAGRGLNKYDRITDSFTHYYPGNSNDLRNTISDIAEDSEGTFWLTTHDGLCRFDERTDSSTFFTYKPEETANRTYNNLSSTIYCDRYKNTLVWYGTWGSGLHSYNKSTGEIKAYLFNFTGPPNITNIISDIEERDENSLWLCTEKGLAIFDKNTGQFQFYLNDPANPHSVIANETRCIYRDKEQVLWVTTGNGFCNAHPAMQNFSFHKFPGTLAPSKLIHDTTNSKVYGVNFYINRSLIILDRKTNTEKIFPIPNADEKNSEPFGLYLDRNGLIWIGCVKSGIYTFDPGTSLFTKFETEVPLGIKDEKLYIYDITEDSAGNIWFASYGYGMIKYDVTKKSFSRYAKNVEGPNQIPFVRCFKIIPGDRGRVYGLFEEEGICILDDSGDKRRIVDVINDTNYTPLLSMTDIAIENNDRMWITTQSHGLVLFDLKKTGSTAMQFYNRSNGFPDNAFSGVLIDGNKNLWLSAHDGVVNVNTQTNKFRIYTEEDGLFPYLPYVTFTNVGDNEIWLGAGPGFLSFHPNKMKFDDSEFTIVLNSFKVFDKELFPGTEVDGMDTIELNHNQNFVSFEFAALCFSNPTAVQYAYILEGFEDEWHYSGNRRYASYTDLKPGDYVLKIKSANSNGNWSKHFKTLIIIIHPAWWQTKLFRISLLVFAIALGILSFRYFAKMKVRKLEVTLERQKEVQDIRNRIARDIHDEIGSGLTKISVMTSKLNAQEDTNQETRSLSSAIQKSSREVIESLGEIVWTVNPKNDSVGNLISYVRQYSGKYFESTTIQHKMETQWENDSLKQKEISPELKRNVLMIVKEALNNIIKHSGAGKCEILFQIEKTSIRLKLSDDGKGISTSREEGFGNGLKNMRKRAEELGGNFKIASTNMQGTSIEITIPFSN